MKTNYQRNSEIRKKLGKSGHGIVNASVDVNDELLTVTKVAIMLERSVEAIRKRIYQKQIPAFKQGRCWYIFKSELMAAIRKNGSSLDMEFVLD